jgi:hypothetical protein
MTQIDASQRLATALREQASAVRRHGQAQRLPGAPSTAISPDAAQVLAQRLRAIDPADPGRRQKAVRIYLESELAREFGASLLGDPEFAQMLDAIESRMRDDAEIAAAVDALGELLVTGSLP